MSTKQRSEDDLRAIFAADASDVPDNAAQRIWAELDTPVHVVRTHPARVRRWAVPLAAAAVVAAIAVPLAVVRVLPHHSATNSGTSPSLRRADLAFTFDVAPVAGLTFTFGVITPTFQTAAIGKNGVDMFGNVTVSSPGTFDPSRIANPKPVTVNGHRGYYGLALPLGTDDAETSGNSVVRPLPFPTVAWEIGPDEWATVYLPEEKVANVRTTELQIAAAVRLTAPRPMLLPFRTGWLPGGTPPMTNAGSIFGFAPLQDWDAGLRFGDPNNPDLDIDEHHPSNGAFKPNATVAGHPAQFYPARNASRPARPTGTRKPPKPLRVPALLTVSLGADAWLTLSGDYSEADLIRIVEHMTFTPTPDDHSTWFDATQ